MTDDQLEEWADATSATMGESGPGAAEPWVAADAQLHGFVHRAVGRRIPEVIAGPDRDHDVMVLTNESRTAVDVRIGRQRLQSEGDGTASDFEAIVEVFVDDLAPG